MSKWDDFQMSDRIQGILDDQVYPKSDHHLERPFLSAYQIAIEYARRYPDDFNSFEMQIGGKGIQEHKSFSQYIGRELSARIRKHTLTDIEGGFFSNLHLRDIKFTSQSDSIHSSSTNSQFPLSIFRSTRPI